MQMNDRVKILPGVISSHCVDMGGFIGTVMEIRKDGSVVVSLDDEYCKQLPEDVVCYKANSPGTIAVYSWLCFQQTELENID